MRLEASFALTAASADIVEFKRLADHLDEEWIVQALEATGTATIRRRRLPAEQVIWVVIGMAMMRDLPITEVVRQLDLALPAAKSGSVAPSAIPSARRRVGSEPVEWIFGRTGAEWAHDSAAAHRWRGLSLYGVDGTTLRVPDSTSNRKTFGGQSAGSKGRGDSGYPIVRLTALMALRSHLLAGASFGPYEVDERVYALDLWPLIPDHSLTLFDRAYLQANVLVPLQSTGKERHWLTRAKSTTAWTVLDKLGKGDLLVEMKVSSEAKRKDPSLPATYRCRCIEYKRPGHPAQRLMTSLIDSVAYPAAELIALYHERWEIELAYDEIKTTVLQRQECIRSQTPDGVRQEIWGILLAYNLVRLEMLRVADRIAVEPTRLSFVASLRALRYHWTMAASLSAGKLPGYLSDVRDEIRTFLLPPRRDRTFPRHVKIKMSNYPRNRRGGRLK
jgi:Insertion element 4 transposase N-terminal/Transposase DDE domain